MYSCPLIECGRKNLKADTQRASACGQSRFSGVFFAFWQQTKNVSEYWQFLVISTLKFQKDEEAKIMENTDYGRHCISRQTWKMSWALWALLVSNFRAGVKSWLWTYAVLSKMPCPSPFCAVFSKVVLVKK